MGFQQTLETLPSVLQARKTEPLEALRGVAALVVVAWHLMIGLAPASSGLFGMPSDMQLHGHWWFFLLNGSAAVSVFFVRSGYVIARGIFARPGFAAIARAMIKRWPRLALVCTIATTVSWMLFHFQLYHFRDVAAITGSPWLADFAYAGLPAKFEPSLGWSMMVGGVLTFFDGTSTMDSSLWTMRAELIGSLMVLGVSPALVPLRRWWMSFLVAAMLSLAMVLAEQTVPQFLLGAWIARWLHEGRPKLLVWQSVVIMVGASFLLGFRGPVGVYDWLGILPLNKSIWHPLLWAPAAGVLILVVECNPAIGRALSGRWARELGRLSFSIYVIHVPVLCSAGAWAFLAVRAADGWVSASLAAIVTTIGVTLLFAWPLSRIDLIWVRFLNDRLRAAIP